jgi:hypothetical protein
MPIRTVWLVKGQVILTQPVGDINESDFISFVADLEALIIPFGEETIVHIIQDARKIGRPYSQLSSVKSFLGILRKFKGWYLVLMKPGNRFFEFVTQFFAQIIGIRTRPAYHDYTELRAFLLERYPDLELPEILPDLFEQTEAIEEAG